MRFTDRPKWKRIILAVICLVGLLAVAGGSFAAYTSQAVKRGVARNSENEAVRFTSDFLQLCAATTEEKDYASKTVIFSDTQKESDSQLPVEINIYNYARGNTNLVSQRDITYDLTITLSGTETGKDYSVSYNGQTYNFTDNVCTISNQKFWGNRADTHTYTVYFPGSGVDKLKITAVAIPSAPSSLASQKLAAVIVPSTGAMTQSFSKKGEFTDAASDALPSEYDGFNYEVSISTGVAQATLRWRSDIVEIDQFFVSDHKLTITTEDNNWASVTFTMDQPNGRGDYLIPFYIKDKSKILESWTWDNMKDVIKFDAVPTETQS